MRIEIVRCGEEVEIKFPLKETDGVKESFYAMGYDPSPPRRCTNSRGIDYPALLDFFCDIFKLDRIADKVDEEPRAVRRVLLDNEVVSMKVVLVDQMQQVFDRAGFIMSAGAVAVEEKIDYQVEKLIELFLSKLFKSR